MAIKRYIANADNTITNAFNSNLTTRGTGSNMGESDILEVFSLYGQASGSSGLSSELSRVLIKFPVADMSTDRTAGELPASGSVKWVLRMFNAPHGQTLPKKFTLNVYALAKDWEEGFGLDMESYSDLTNDGEGSNWENASENVQWSTPGGDFLVTGSGKYDAKAYTYYFEKGTEDLELDISELVEEWIDGGSVSNYGLAVFLSGTQEAFFSGSGLTVQGGDFGTGKPEIPIDHKEDIGQTPVYTATPAVSGNVLFNITGSFESFYTKKFFARGSEFFYKRPCIEARWDDTVKDDRGQFYYSSSMAPEEENLNTLYFYNVVRGRLMNIPDVNNVFVTLFSGSDLGADSTEISGGMTDTPPSKLILSAPGEEQNICAGLDTGTGSAISTGVYTCTICLTSSYAENPLTVIHDVWHSADLKAAGNVTYFTGTIRPIVLQPYSYDPTNTYVTNITNLRSSYSIQEKARFRMFIRPRNWQPNIFNKATQFITNTIVNSGSYRVVRTIDDLDVIEYGTGSIETSLRHTHLSYDSEGNYFDLDMELLEPGYSYQIKFTYYNDSIGSWIEQPQTFKFRVEK